jgi:hypothetical protein
MARPTYVERRAAIAILAYGLLWGIAVTLAFFGIVWLPFSAAGLGIVVGIRYFASGGRALDFGPWFTGASGESQVSQALKELEPLGYTVINDVNKGHGNVDHVVVGPTGVFAIETKNRGGRVVADRGRLINRWDAKYASQTVHEAMWVRDRVAVRFVKALLVYPSAKVEPDVILLPRVTVLSLARLNAEITSQPASLSADEIQRVTKALSA